MEKTLIIAGIFLVAVLALWQILWHGVRFANARARRLVHRIPASSRLREHPLRVLFAEKYPFCSKFLHRRFRPDRFTGLPLTLFILAGIYFATLLSGLVEEVVNENKEITATDQRLSDYLDPIRTEGLIHTFVELTDFGAFATLAALAIVVSGFLWAHRRVHRIAGLWITVLGSQATTYLGKYVFDRQRPEFLVPEMVETTASFPSGHATGAMAVYGFLAYTIARELRKARERFEIGYWSAILIFLIGFSRVFLNVHYPSDVAAGFLVGVFWLLVGVAVSEQLQKKANIPKEYTEGERPHESPHNLPGEAEDTESGENSSPGTDPPAGKRE